jgi:hypothetical protein
MKILHVSDSSSVNHQESSTVHTAIHTGYVDCLLASSQAADDGQRNCPKDVESSSKNKFEILVHLGGFIVRIHHDTPTSERQMCKKSNLFY